MDLLLWRHAEAANGTPDEARELTPHGRHQAEHMAKWLKKHAPKDLRIIVSPAIRTQQTILAWTRHFETDPLVGTAAHAEDILTVVGWPETKQPVLVVGHQPTLGEVASVLLYGHAAPLAFKKGALWWLRHRVRDGQSQTVLHTVIAPDLADNG